MSADEIERNVAEAWRWVEFGRRLAHEQATHILALQGRIRSQRGALAHLHELYADKLRNTGIADWARICLDRYAMIRVHYQDLAGERNRLRDRLATERAVTDALVAALPRCGAAGCGRVATRRLEAGRKAMHSLLCETHGTGSWYELIPYGPALLALGHARQEAS